MQTNDIMDALPNMFRYMWRTYMAPMNKSPDETANTQYVDPNGNL